MLYTASYGSMGFPSAASFQNPFSALLKKNQNENQEKKRLYMARSTVACDDLFCQCFAQIVCLVVSSSDASLVPDPPPLFQHNFPATPPVAIQLL